MKLICNQEELAWGLTVINHIATKNVSLPILNNVLLKADKGWLELTTTNLEITTSARVPCQVEAVGETTVQASLFSNIVSLLAQKEITLTLVGTEVLIQGADQETKIHAIAATEYPVIPAVTKEVNFIFNKGLFREALSQVLFSATVNEVRPEISGILFHIHGDTLTLAATDSYRLSERHMTLEKKQETRRFIVPLRAAQELMRLLGVDSGAEVEVISASNQVQFIIGAATLTSRLIEGNYPAYEQIIPDTYKTRVFCSNDDLLRAVRRASLFCVGGVNDIALHCKPGKGEGPGKGGEIVVSATNANLGESKTVLPAIVEGLEQSIVFNYRYIIEGLQHLNAAEVQVDVISESSPGVFRPAGKMAQSGQYLYLIMPIKAS